MTQHEQIQALRDEIAQLRDEVASLKVQVAQMAAQPVQHHHHYYPPVAPPVPQRSPLWPQYSPTCGGQVSIAGSAPDQTYNWGSA